MRKLLAASALFAIAVAAACSTFGSGDDENNVDGGDDAGQGGGDTSSGNDGAPSEIDGAVDGAPSDGGAKTDGDAGPCDLATPQGSFFKASFDNGSCESWFVTNGTIDPVPSPSRCGAGSCKVCATGDYATLSRDLLVDRPDGAFELRYEVRGDTFTGSVQGVLYVYADADGGAAITSNANSTPVIQKQWTGGQVIVPHDSPVARIAVRVIGPPDAGGLCYYVDEIRLGHD